MSKPVFAEKTAARTTSVLDGERCSVGYISRRFGSVILVVEIARDLFSTQKEVWGQKSTGEQDTR
jgi:hypothetical protein